MSSPLPLPHKIRKVVTGWDAKKHGQALCTRNKTAVFGHEAGTLVLSTLYVRTVDKGQPGEVEVEYEWDVARAIGGVPPEKLFSDYEHHDLPGVDES